MKSFLVRAAARFMLQHNHTPRENQADPAGPGYTEKRYTLYATGEGHVRLAVELMS